MDIGWIGPGKGSTTWTTWNGYRKGKGKNYKGKQKGNYKGGYKGQEQGTGFGKNYRPVEGGEGYHYGGKKGYNGKGKGKGKGKYYKGKR